MNCKYFPSSLILFVIFILSCGSPEQKPATDTATQRSDLSFDGLIPKPVSAQTTGGVFEFSKSTSIIIETDLPELKKIGEYLANKLKPATGFPFEVVVAAGEKKMGNIYLSIEAPGKRTNKENDEAYSLVISKEHIDLTAGTAPGLFRGLQTILQLLPDEIASTVTRQDSWKIATGTITDYPLYGLRGSMLDLGRHFFDMEEVKRFIDLNAFYKMNLLHLHLSDDQGWRIEIKSWPDLTAHGGSTEVGGGKGGFYTQEQYKEIVQYALDRYIMIIPEIDMPGHTNAALASYAELNCNKKATKLYTGTNVGFSTLCTKNEITYKFVDDVVRELAALTPGPYIHIGGDESHATPKADYIPFVNRVQQIVTKYGKKVIGWDEIALSTLAPNSVAQFWADSANSVNAVKQGAKIMMSPAKRTYLDMQYDSTTRLGLHWAGYIEVDSAYAWDPANWVKGIVKENIIGIEAPLWSETITNMEDIEYMTFPRLPGYAEIGWSPAARSWDEYKIRLGKHGKRMKAMGIDYYKSPKVSWAE